MPLVAEGRSLTAPSSPVSGHLQRTSSRWRRSSVTGLGSNDRQADLGRARLIASRAVGASRDSSSLTQGRRRDLFRTDAGNANSTPQACSPQARRNTRLGSARGLLGPGPESCASATAGWLGTLGLLERIRQRAVGAAGRLHGRKGPVLGLYSPFATPSSSASSGSKSSVLSM